MKKRKVVSVVCGLVAVSAAAILTWNGIGMTVRADVNSDGSVTIDEKNFPDSAFREIVKTKDSDSDGKLSEAERKWITYLSLYSTSCKSVEGIEYLDYLTQLHIGGSHSFTTLDVSKSKSLRELSITSNVNATIKLKELIVNGATSLERIDCSSNALTKLDVSNTPSLKTLICNGNKFTSLDLSGHASLQTIECSSNPLQSLNCSNMKALKSLSCNLYSYSLDLKSLSVSGDTSLETLSILYHNLTELDLSTCTSLKTLDCTRDAFANVKPDPMVTLDLTKNTKLETLKCAANGIQELKLPSSGSLVTIEGRRNAFTSLDVSNQTSLTKLDCSWGELQTLNVGSLKSLTILNCSSNKIASLDVSGCTNLSELDCGYNKLESLPLPSGTKLTKVICASNLLSGLNVSSNTALVSLDCSFNEIEELNLSKLTKLERLICSYNKLTSLDVSNKTKLKTLECKHEVGSYGIRVDFPKIQSLAIDGDVELTYFSCSGNEITALNLAGFSKLVELNCESNSLSSLDLSDSLMISEVDCADNSISSLKFGSKAELTELDCYGNKLTSLDLSSAPNLYYLDCSNNKLTSLKVSGDTSLAKLQCKNNALTSLNLSNLTSIEKVVCQNNQIKTLNLSGVTTLTELTCYGNQLEKLDVSKQADLTKLDCENNKLASLVLSGAAKLKKLDCSTNLLVELDLKQNTALVELECDENSLTKLDLSKNTALEELDCSNNQITSLDFSKNVALKEVDCPNNLLTSLTINGATALERIDCTCNKISSLDLSKSANLCTLECYANNIQEMQIDGAPNILSFVKGVRQEWATHCYGKEYPFYCYSLTANYSSTNHLQCDLFTGLVSKSLTPTPTPPAPGKDSVLLNSTNFPDPNFLEYLKVAGCDSNRNGALEVEELQNVKTISCSNYGIKSLNGISYFTELSQLICRDNEITYLDLSGLINLNGLACDGNQIQVINVYDCPDLVMLVENGERKHSSDGTYDFYYDVLPGRRIADMYFDTNVQFAVDKPITDKKLEVGKTFQYSIAGIPASSIKWSVGNTSIATVDANGKVTGKSIGNTYLHVGLPGGKTIKCLIRVAYPDLNIRYTEKTLHINQTFTFTVSNTAGQQITWSVGNTSVASVDANGKVTGKKAANTYLYAKSADGRVAKCLVKVIDPGTLGINYTEKTVYLGQSFTFTAKNKGILTPTWSTGNSAVAKVDSNGKVTSVSVGNTYLYVKTEDGRSARCLVKVVDPGPLSITYTEKTIKVGSTFQFTAKNPAGQIVSWRVGNTSVATVDASGKVTGKSVANTWLYASTPDGREVKCLLKIVA